VSQLLRTITNFMAIEDIEKQFREEVVHLASQQNQGFKKLIEAGNKKDLIKHCLPIVLEIADSYRDNEVRLEYMDLVGAGYEALVEHINWGLAKGRLRKLSFLPRVEEIIEEGIKKTILTNILEGAKVTYDSDFFENALNEGVDEEEPYMNVIVAQDKAAVDRALDTLAYREREIIRLRYGIGDGHTYTLEEVGRKFRITRPRIREIEAKALRKLQNPVRSRKLVDIFEPGYIPPVRPRQIVPPLSDTDSLEKTLERAKEDIEILTGESLHKFRAHYDLSKTQFANFLRGMYPELTKMKSFRLIELSDEERKQMASVRTEQAEQYSNIGSM